MLLKWDLKTVRRSLKQTAGYLLQKLRFTGEKGPKLKVLISLYSSSKNQYKTSNSWKEAISCVCLQALMDLLAGMPIVPILDMTHTAQVS